MIIGRDLLKDLGIDVLFSTLTFEWTRMNASIPMKPYDFSFAKDVYIADSLAVEANSNRLSSILDAKYAPTDIAKYVSEQKAKYVSEQKAFSIKERSELFNLLKAYEGLFNDSIPRSTAQSQY